MDGVLNPLRIRRLISARLHHDDVHPLKRSDNKWAMGGNKKLNVRKRISQCRQNGHLPFGMQMEIDLINHHNPMVLSELLPARTGDAYVIEEIAKPSYECAVTIRHCGIWNF